MYFALCALVMLLLGCVDDYSCYAVMATVYSKLHDAANTIAACQKGCDTPIVTLLVRMYVILGLELMNTCAVSLQNRVSCSLK